MEGGWWFSGHFADKAVSGGTCYIRLYTPVILVENTFPPT